MPQAITTKSLAATNTRPSRVKASVEAGSVTRSWDHSLDADGNHDAACVALLAKLGWGGAWARGWTDARTAVYVHIDHPFTATAHKVEAR
jgi:hypothetical protein